MSTCKSPTEEIVGIQITDHQNVNIQITDGQNVDMQIDDPQKS
jgi:hypothetical protein